MRLLKKCKIERALGTHLFLKGNRCASPKCGASRRPYAPGIHGNKKKRRGGSEFGKQLKEKQKLRFTYFMSERQLQKYVNEVKGKEGAAELLLAKLEGRLDSVAYRIGLCSSRSNARQMISHGAFLVNGKKNSFPSYAVKTGDVITLKKNKQEKLLTPEYQTMLKKRESPSWITFDAGSLSATIKSKPSIEEVKNNFDLQSITEYYSR